MLDGLLQRLLLRFPRLGRAGVVQKAHTWARAALEARYVQDRLITCQTPQTFMEDPAFLRAYQAGEATGSWGGNRVHWRVHVLCWAARQALGVEGDFVECGVNRGGYARAVMEYVDFRSTGRCFHLLDSFAGMPSSYVRRMSGGEDRSFYLHYGDCYEAVRKTFEGDPVHLVKGIIPDSLGQMSRVSSVAFLSIDLNFAEPEIAALEFFWPRLQPGALVVLDDHGFRGYEDQRLAHVAFARRQGVPILALPTGQGVVIKP